MDKKKEKRHIAMMNKMSIRKKKKYWTTSHEEDTLAISIKAFSTPLAIYIYIYSICLLIYINTGNARFTLENSRAWNHLEHENRAKWHRKKKLKDNGLLLVVKSNVYVRHLHRMTMYTQWPDKAKESIKRTKQKMRNNKNQAATTNLNVHLHWGQFPKGSFYIQRAMLAINKKLFSLRPNRMNGNHN